ncbi:MAG: papain-like cysteine peptidase [bacterium]|nr:papain-like cysteine peptidase [bacterium]
MSKLGVRNFSGPFDWYFNYDFEAVLHCIETEFEGFLDKRNLVLEENGQEFRDIKNHFLYVHEVKTTFEDDYEKILHKYQRRIAVFMEEIKKRTCFIRGVHNQEELSYVKDHEDYINKVIKKYNKENEIIYVVIGVGDCSFSHPFYRGKAHDRSREGIRSLFDLEPKLQEYCIQHFDENKRYRNLTFDLQSENQNLQKIVEKYNLLLRLEKADIKEDRLPPKAIIYGMSLIGKILYQKIRKKCEILFFVDKDPKEGSYEGTPVIRYDEFRGEEYAEIPIIVTPYYFFDNIEADMKRRYGEMNLVSVLKILERS